MDFSKHISYFKLHSTSLCDIILKTQALQSCFVLSLLPLFHYFRVRFLSAASTLRQTSGVQPSCSDGRWAARGRCFPALAASPQCRWSTRSAFDCCRTQWRTERGSRGSAEDNNTWTGWIPGATRSAAAYLRVQQLKLALLCTSGVDEDAAAAIFCYFRAYLCPKYRAEKLILFTVESWRQLACEQNHGRFSGTGGETLAFAPRRRRLR